MIEKTPQELKIIYDEIQSYDKVEEVSENVLIVGNSGGGKTTGIRNMNRERTALLNVENQRMPFSGGDFKYQMIPKTVADIDMALAKCSEARRQGKIDCIIIDGLTKIQEIVIATYKKSFTGHEIYGMFGSKIIRILDVLTTLGCPVIITSIMQASNTGFEGGVMHHAYFEGNMLSGKIEKTFNTVLFTETVRTVREMTDEESKELGGIKMPVSDMGYFLRTITDTKDTCKSPAGMLPQYIHNDYNDLLLAILKNR